MAPTPPVWDPQRYLTFSDERARPFVDLLARVPAENPRSVVDLGCGPGTLTALLAERWPSATVRGVDSSPEMIAAARTAHPRVEVELADLRAWAARDDSVDVLVSNATLQWAQGHLELLPDLVAHLTAGGWFAFQVPGNFGEPSHTLLHSLAAEAPYERYTRDVARPESHDPVVYLDALTDCGCSVDAWETTYLHVLTGPDPVFTWISGTGARPTLQALPDDLRPQFETDYRARLRAAYPQRHGRVVLPFRRVFVVAQAGSSPRA